MNGLLSLIIYVVIIITVIGTLVRFNKEKPNYKTPRKKMYKKIVDQMEMGKELKILESEPNRYAIPKRTYYNHSDTVHPANEGILRWNKAFLRSLEWKRYEDVCMEYLRIRNCNANVTCTGADGGIDIKVADKYGNLIAIGQCKAWNKPIGVNLIRELYGVMASERVKHGVFLTTSVFSPDAIEFAKNKTLLLIDGDEFVNLINGLEDTDKRRIDKMATKSDYSTPTCVHCNVKMVKRTATKGKNEGNEFWGCVNYPRCKKIMFVKI